jgi:ATP-dependent helicase/nuclease subunit A
MAEKKLRWTDQQLRAIKQRGSDVLVTASAGTGKTAVLSGRCVDIVADQLLCPDIWSILVLTFTDMAAEQMRSRIAQQLKDAFLESGNPHLRQQLVLLDAADISTIHSFCKRLITEYFYKLDLDPTFSVIDADEARLLKAEALEETIDWAWQQSHLVEGLEQLFRRRDLRTNDGFLAKIIDISDFLDGVVLRTDWYERAARFVEAASPFASGLGVKQKQIVGGKLQEILDCLRHAQNLYEGQNPDGQWAQNLENTHIRPVRQCIEFLQASNWNQCVQTIRDFAKPKTSTPRELSESVAKLLHDAAKDAIDGVKELLHLAIVNPDYLDRVSDSVGSQTRVVVELVKKFDEFYSQAKRAVNCLDFADLEHKALELLTDQDSSQDNLVPSQTALLLRRRYKYIFVDEYQDINPVQQAILRMLSSKGNVFVVGDVKQSIYAFRGAEPEIFVSDLKSASLDPADAHAGLRVDLNANFRSTKAILDFVNKLFSRIMTAPFASIDYDRSAELTPALELKGVPVCSEKNVVELHILDETAKDADSQGSETAQGETSESQGDEGLNVVSSQQRQAAMIAQRIRQMVGTDTGKPAFQIYDKDRDKLRDVQYRDIVILMRSLAKKANDYVEVLRLAGVPVSCQATAGYFEATEITDILSLLKILDNPQRDIELAAVLRSPFFKISDTDLAKIKAHSRTIERRENFYKSVLAYCKSGKDLELAKRLKEILAQIEDWRTLARRGSLADLIWRIYRQTGFLSFVSALPNGQARRANLLKLHDRAIQFEGFASSAGIASLTRFVEFIERLEEIGQDWAPAEPEAAAGNAVRILSVHKSKGLEFPVVFLAELESGFNRKDIQSDILADADDTLGVQIIDRTSNSKLSSLAHQVIAEQKLAKSLAEEMRILYVATTRARDRLILTASQKQDRCRNTIYDGFFFGAQPIPHWRLRRCHSHLDWTLYGLSDQKALHNAFQTHLSAQNGADDLFSLKVYDGKELDRLSRFVLSLRADKTKGRILPQRKQPKRDAETELLLKLKDSLAWQYQFADATLLPAKLSVTQLTHRSDEYIKLDYSGVLQRQPKAVAAAEVESTEPDAGLIGTATHLIIAQLDLAGPINKETIDQTIERLLSDGSITQVVVEHIDTDSILAFFKGDLGRMVFDKANQVWREWTFTFALPVSQFWDHAKMEKAEACPERSRRNTECTEIKKDNSSEFSVLSVAKSDETIVVQGIIDILIQTKNGLIVIDFKTDNVTAKQAVQRAELYRRQLELYSRAASAILKSNVLAKWLYFLAPATEFEVKS